MADKKISALTAASTPLAGTEVLPIVQSGATVKVPVSDLTAGLDVSASTMTQNINYTTARAAIAPTYSLRRTTLLYYVSNITIVPSWTFNYIFKELISAKIRKTVT